MMLEVVVQGLQPAALAYMSAAVAVVGAISVFGLLYVDRRWASYAALIVEVILLSLFVYSVNLVYTLYSAPGFGSLHDIELGIAYQRVVAGVLSAMLFIAALVAIGYYMELQRRGHE